VIRFLRFLVLASFEHLFELFLADDPLVALRTALSRREARSHLNGNENRGGFVTFGADFRGKEVARLVSQLVKAPIGLKIPGRSIFPQVMMCREENMKLKCLASSFKAGG
jgi:hypothetical protein